MDNHDSLIEKLVDSGSKESKMKDRKYNKEEIYVSLPVSKNFEIEVAKVSWFDREAKYEIRKWKKDGTAGKGVTMKKETFIDLLNLLKDIEIE